ALLAVLIDALPAHVLQNEVGLSSRLDASIQESRDVRMVQRSGNASLTRKALLRRMPDQGGIQELYRYLSFEAAVAAMCEPDGAHAAEPKRPFEGVRANGVPFQAGRQLGANRCFEELGVRNLCDTQQARPDVRRQLRCTGLEILQPGLARAARQIQRLVEQGADLAPP